jgi:transcriptional regulator with XRE-family HTH domain
LTLDPQRLGRSRTDLAHTLKTLRKRAGLSQARLAQRCAMSQSKISKIETGELTPGLVDVERLLGALKAPPHLITEVTALARMANTEWQDFRSSRRKGLEKKQSELSCLEKTATELRYFLLSMITGLLATPEYIRESIAHVPGDQTKVVTKKLERQSILHDVSKRFTFVLTEQAVRWPLLPPAGMAMQIDRLVSLSRLPNVRVGVLPLGNHVRARPLSTFTLYDRRMATVETPTGVMVFKDHRDISAYAEEFATYESCALFEDLARDHLSRWADDCRS